MTRRSIASGHPWLLYGTWVVLCCLLFSHGLRELARYSLNHDSASHVLVIPAVVAWLLYHDRAKLAKTVSPDLTLTLLFALLAIALWGASRLHPAPGGDAVLSVTALSFILLLLAGFLAVFGRSSARAVWFSLAFLGFAVPLPGTLLDRAIYLLQYGSAAVAERIFDWTRMPVLREGFVFHLPTVDIEVARECSGIRSSIALVILAILIAHFSFTRFWKKALFVSAGLLMMVAKNGVRIVTLTILATRVDPRFLTGRLHHDGGVVFFLFGLVLLIPVYWLLRKGEMATAGTRSEASGRARA